MKNVTITLDDLTARSAKQVAAEQGKSLSRYIGDLLQQTMKETQNYERSMQAWFARGAYFCSEPGTVYPTREEIYAERTRIR
jgi:Family of unknown function (DUF6364)